MTQIQETIDESISVVPGEDQDNRGQQHDAGHDTSIAERLERDPESKEARLDCALDQSMDASDPPASTQPIHNHGPAPSSGYDEAAEKERQQDA